MSFLEEINRCLNNNSNEDALMSDSTPSFLIDSGCRDLPMYISAHHVRSILSDFDDAHSNHGLSSELLEKVPEAMKHPVYVIDSDSCHDSIVMVLDLYDEMNQPLMVAVRLNGFEYVNGKKIDVNFVKSVYGKRPNGVMGTLSRATKDGRVLYINKQKFYAMQSHFVTTFAIKQLSKYKTCHSYQSVNAQNAVTNREMYALRYMHYAG